VSIEQAFSHAKWTRDPLYADPVADDDGATGHSGLGFVIAVAAGYGGQGFIRDMQKLVAAQWRARG